MDEDVVLRPTTESFFLGVGTVLALSFGVYLGTAIVCCASISKSPTFVLIVCPTAIFTLAVVILFYAQHLIVQTSPFLFGSFFGIAGGHILARIVYWCKYKRKKAPRVASAEDDNDRLLDRRRCRSRRGPSTIRNLRDTSSNPCTSDSECDDDEDGHGTGTDTTAMDLSSL
mmetsp:Transcript_14313/g.40504  ORF Transcript_14313/g.40504 Transcript_14313/m.40504 type:complete len:171 (-) Transcript_14313:141-653(-)